MNECKLLEISLAAGVSLMCFSAQATSNGGPKIGDKPPLLQATALLQASAGAKLGAESMRGKVVVLEFWATWCGPCVAAIRHLNELAEQFKDQSVQFVAITAEEEAKVKPFLMKRPIKAWIALDTNKAMNKAYGVIGIPHMVVLAKDGTIAAITAPTELTKQHLDDLLQGKKISLPEQRQGDETTASKAPDDKGQAQPLFEILVRPSSYTNSTGYGGGGRFTARAYTVWDLLPRAFDQPMQSPVRILTNGPLPEGRYDFLVVQPMGTERYVSALLQQALQSAFGLTGRKETKEMDVMLLKVKEPNARGLVVSPTEGGASRSGPGLVDGTGFSLAGLAMALERALNKPVLDETGMTNRYDVLLKWEQKTWDKPNPEGLMKAVQEQLGLELVPAKRPVQVLVVERAEANGKRAAAKAN